MVMWWPTCNYNTCTRARRASFLILPMMGAWRPKHVEWVCRNKTCTVLHQVGVLFDLYYDARKHKIKTKTIIPVVFQKLILPNTSPSMTTTHSTPCPSRTRRQVPWVLIAYGSSHFPTNLGLAYPSPFIQVLSANSHFSGHNEKASQQ